MSSLSLTSLLTLFIVDIDVNVATAADVDNAVDVDSAVDVSDDVNADVTDDVVTTRACGAGTPARTGCSVSA